MENMYLTKDTYEYLLNFTDDRTIINMLSTNKKLSQKLNVDDFFKQLLKKRYPFLLEFKKENETFKQFYLREIYYIAKIEEKYKIPYYSLKGYDPEYNYKKYRRLYNGTEPQKYYFEKFLLFLAVEHGNFNEIKKIINKTNDLYTLNQALILAAKYGYLEIVKFLIVKGATDIYNSLEQAASEGHLNIVKYLVETYKIKHLRHAIEDAEINKRNDVINYLRTV